MTALIQNFSVPADNDVAITLGITPVMSLDASTIYWRVYQQQFGIPNFDVEESPSGSSLALIEKSTTDGTITVLPSPPDVCTIQLAATDTVNLLRNYYHETTLVDPAGNLSTLNCGIMTVTESLNR